MGYKEDGPQPTYPDKGPNKKETQRANTENEMD
ncbi:hypothetical protein COLO4_37801 [Corchorus olitorius]|uniref:Uncharacterized protein n=1 Tax=Corchorus olitorius TaxID=93759 RepID=A0A1R3FZ86_9ROSI|nr:hypothetical protein COLO4_37801 [Corchorus olitorius]